jgi:8-oxo-dGTP pyrophosphatase MutT (NUDIX family)
MVRLIDNLQIQLLKKLPGFAAQMLMAPPVRSNIPMAPINAKQSAVLLLLYAVTNDVQIILIQRTIDGGVHSGQIALPGGKVEANDGSKIYTAMRETYEELGIESNSYKLLGSLTPLYVPPSNYVIHPILAYATQPLHFIPSPSEVAQVYQVSLLQLFAHKSTRVVYRSDDKNITMQAPVYLLNENTNIWGATAMMLSELEQLYLAANIK